MKEGGAARALLTQATLAEKREERSKAILQTGTTSRSFSDDTATNKEHLVFDSFLIEGDNTLIRNKLFVKRTGIFVLVCKNISSSRI